MILYSLLMYFKNYQFITLFYEIKIKQGFKNLVIFKVSKNDTLFIVICKLKLSKLSIYFTFLWNKNQTMNQKFGNI